MMLCTMLGAGYTVVKETAGGLGWGGVGWGEKWEGDRH